MAMRVGEECSKLVLEVLLGLKLAHLPIEASLNVCVRQDLKIQGDIHVASIN